MRWDGPDQLNCSRGDLDLAEAAAAPAGHRYRCRQCEETTSLSPGRADSSSPGKLNAKPRTEGRSGGG